MPDSPSPRQIGNLERGALQRSGMGKVTQMTITVP